MTLSQTKLVSVCYECEYPLTWTFMWDYHEWYCINCGQHYGMLGVDEKEVDLKTIRQARARWGCVSGKLQPNSGWRRDCEFCESHKEPHSRHLTEQEKKGDKWARELLEKWKEN